MRKAWEASTLLPGRHLRCKTNFARLKLDAPHLLLVHGAADTDIPVQERRDVGRSLADAGFDVAFAEQPGHGHGVSGEQLQAAMEWSQSRRA
ncbi:MAG: hypothetical protein B7Z23_13150 [Pseudomonadales bacterium 32-61-5]|nr:MAG: hypothetical protein B7Z23_13150 [Pseudomonadales bacterium 32-61-5]